MATQAKKSTNAKKIEDKDIVKEKKEIIKKEINSGVENTFDNTKIKELEDALKSKDEELLNLTKESEAMKAKMDLILQQLALANQNAINNSPATSNNEDDMVEVGCRKIYGDSLVTHDESYVYKFACNEIKFIPREDMKAIINDRGNRRNISLFEKDIFYFINPEEYKKFKIKKKVDLSKENILRILKLPEYEMINEVNLLTNNLINFSTTHAFQFEVAKLLIDKVSLADWKYENRVALERYLGKKFDDLLASVGTVELAQNKKII